MAVLVIPDKEENESEKDAQPPQQLVPRKHGTMAEQFRTRKQAVNVRDPPEIIQLEPGLKKVQFGGTSDVPTFRTSGGAA